jgi:Ni,Fe-hydrogenase III small subunit
LAVTVQVPGTSATPEEITESVGQQLPSMLLAALEQLNTQAGLA